MVMPLIIRKSLSGDLNKVKRLMHGVAWDDLTYRLRYGVVFKNKAEPFDAGVAPEERVKNVFRTDMINVR